MTIRGAAFYERVGRKDLADSFRGRRLVRIASRVVGGLSVGLGALTWVGDNQLCGEEPRSARCLGRGPDWGPLIAVATGIVLLGVPALWENDPVSGEEKRALAHEAVLEARYPVSLNVGVAPAAGGDGGELVLSGRF